MIKAYNLDKFFYKGKNNEIHVIKDCTLSLPDTGLVCLLGPSGSGKTTLMNVLGGLDRPYKGKIAVQENEISKYNANKWDQIRSKHYGYIFQNYNLLLDLSVYENVAITLKMTDLEKDEADKRIEYALNAVNMGRYRKKKASQLSGGQQQRVAIARALVKSPDVIFADEPTGNLDEKNTTQIMNIIKKISKKCLILMVTHEERLAAFYADRIIRLADGKIISDEINESSKTYELKDDQNIYLGDLNQDQINNQDVSLKYFYQDDKPKLDLKVVYRNNTYYVLSDAKIKILNHQSEIKLIEGKKPMIDAKSIDDFEYDLNKVYFTSRALIKTKECVKMAFKRFSQFRIRDFYALLAFFALSFLFLLALSFLSGSVFDNRSKYITDYESTIVIDKGNLDIETLKAIKGTNGIADYMLNSQIPLCINPANFIQNKEYYIYDMVTPTLINQIDSTDLIYGVMPSNNQDIVISKEYAKSLLEDVPDYKAIGINQIDDFIGLDFYIEYNLYYGKIVGIVNCDSENVFINQDSYYSIVLSNYHQIGFSEEIDAGNVWAASEMLYLDFNTTNGTSYIKQEHDVNYPVFENNIYVFNPSEKENLLLYGVCNYVRPTDISHLKIISTDKTQTIAYLKTLDVTAYDALVKAQIDYQDANKTTIIATSIIAIIFLAVSIIFLSLMMRSSIISRLYEIGVYRNIGVRKEDIYKIFIWEIIFISGITSILGIGFGTVLAGELQKFLESIEVINIINIYMPWYLAIVVFLIYMGVSICLGLIPLYTLLRKTPSEITAKYDI